MALAKPRTVSLEEFRAGIDDEELYARCEYWDGEIILKDPDFYQPVSPVRYHSYVQMALGARLFAYLQANPVGTVLSEMHCFLPGAKRACLPDLCVVLGDLAIDDHPLEQAPELVVEILSPGDRAGAVARKVDLYLRSGVKMVWLVDFSLRQAWVHRPDAPVGNVPEDGALDGGDLLPGLRIPLASVLPPRKQ